MPRAVLYSFLLPHLRAEDLGREKGEAKKRKVDHLKAILNINSYLFFIPYHIEV